MHNQAIQALINSPALMHNAREILAGIAQTPGQFGQQLGLAGSPAQYVSVILPQEVPHFYGSMPLAAFTNLPSDFERLRAATSGNTEPPLTPRIMPEAFYAVEEDEDSEPAIEDTAMESDEKEDDFDLEAEGDEKGVEDELLQALRMDTTNGQGRLHVVQGPAKHQVKEFNILPNNIIQVKYTAKNSDYILIRLICDKKLHKREKVIFLSAISPKHAANEEGEIVLGNLKISKEMLQGRTKGYKFCLAYTLVENGKEVETIKSNTFYIWSNVNQPGFPRKQREQYLAQRIRNNKKNRRKNN